jgi:4-aminobutyrate aminotransferase-like enzyme
VAAAAAELRAAGDRPALLLVDPGFTSEGVLDPPAEFLAGLVAGAHESGALFVADEVQVGYGRIGPPLWHVAFHGLRPDVVTLGKPMGAGYPVGAVVTRREIAAALARDYEYFSTFAATPAAAAAGLAVLDTLRDSDIPASAARVGEYLRQQLRTLGLGEVRGRGLIAGVDVPPAAARDLLDALAARKVLAGLTGPAGSVLKIRPPLVWREEHVDVLLAALAAAVAETTG